MLRDRSGDRSFAPLRDVVGRTLIDPIRRRRGRKSAGSESEQRRARLLKSNSIDVVIDVGANTGQFASKVRGNGYDGRIVSFEPFSAAFDQLARATETDPAWDARCLALGPESGEAVLHVAGNSFSSSLLEMERIHVDFAPDSEYVAEERVPMARLEAIWAEMIGDTRAAWLKIDTQGYELGVLEGAGSRLDAVRIVELELSLVALYVGQPLWQEVVGWLDDRGFALVGVEPGIWDWHTGRMLQMDGFFANARAA